MCECVFVCVCACVCTCAFMRDYHLGVLTLGSTNKEFNFRHDWNSLISDDESLSMKHYTKAYFPQADVYVSYWLIIHKPQAPVLPSGVIITYS